MRYRRLTSAGDYTFGQGSQDFVSDIDAVAQAVYTRLNLYRETWWRDLTDGVPMFQSILGTPGSPANLANVDSILQSRINGTQGVTALTYFTSEFNPVTRQYSYTANVQTIYSTTVIQGTI